MCERFTGVGQSSHVEKTSVGQLTIIEEKMLFLVAPLYELSHVLLLHPFSQRRGRITVSLRIRS